MKQDVYKKETEKNSDRQAFGRMSARFSNRVRPTRVKGTLKRLLQYSGRELKILFAVFLIVLLTAVMNLTAPRLIGLIVDQLFDNQFDHTLTVMIASLAVLYIMISVGTWLSEFLVVGTSQRIIDRLRHDLFQKLSKLPITYFDTHSHGDIVSRFTNDIDNVNVVLSQSTTAFIRSIITFAGALGLMLYLNIYLTLGVLLSVPLVFGLSKLIARRTIDLYRAQQRYTGEINSRVEETVYGLNIVQAYNQQEQFSDVFEKANDSLYHYSKNAQLWTGLLMPVLNVINNLTFGVIGLMGGYLVIKGMTSVGIVTSFIVYSRSFIRPINELASIYNALMAAIAGSQRVFQILDELEESETVGAKEDLQLSGDFTFDKVKFAYVPGKPVIKQLSLKVKKGMKVAIVGPTGAGKTTIVNLITRFYCPDEGVILADDVPLELITRSHLRQQIGFVLQDTYLFSGTIWDNIQYGNLSATENQIIEASKLAGAHDFICKLPHQYQTKLTYGGMNLSHGERQLITIARAVLLEPNVMILDEATSSVDIATERRISASMQHLMAGRTSFIIAHRLSTIVSADLILVMKSGEVVESGNHKALMENKGFYAEMYRIQCGAN